MLIETVSNRVITEISSRCYFVFQHVILQITQTREMSVSSLELEQSGAFLESRKNDARFHAMKHHTDQRVCPCYSFNCLPLFVFLYFYFVRPDTDVRPFLLLHHYKVFSPGYLNIPKSTTNIRLRALEPVQVFLIQIPDYSLSNERLQWDQCGYLKISYNKRLRGLAFTLCLK